MTKDLDLKTGLGRRLTQDTFTWEVSVIILLKWVRQNIFTGRIQ